MFTSDGNRFPPCKNWEQWLLKGSSYAACMQDHPVYRLDPRATQVSPYSLALLDFIGKPQLVRLDASRWTGRVGQKMRIQVSDNVRILRVHVMIRAHRSSSQVLESGPAYPSKRDPGTWIYRTQTRIRRSPGLCVDVVTGDLPGNIGIDTIEYR